MFFTLMSVHRRPEADPLIFGLFSVLPRLGTDSIQRKKLNIIG